MKPEEILRFVDQIHLEKKIDKENLFGIIEEAIAKASEKYSGDGYTRLNAAKPDIVVHVDRKTGEISVFRDGIPISAEECSDHIGAQIANQHIRTKIRDAEREMIYKDVKKQEGQLVTGKVFKIEKGTVIVKLTNYDDQGFLDVVLPGKEKIPTENLRIDDRIGALVTEVQKVEKGGKIKVRLSRTRPLFVQRLFEREIPEISEGIIEIKCVSRMAGHRSKVAVFSDDPRIDTKGSCIGPRGLRIKTIRDELGTGEQIDVVLWSEDATEFIREALKPAVVDEVILCNMMGRAIVLVRADQRSLAIGRRGQNVNLASRLCGIDIDIMTRDDLEKILDNAIAQFTSIPGVTPELAERLVGEGVLNYDDLSVVEPSDLMELGQLTEEEVVAITEEAERCAEEEAARMEREEYPSVGGQPGGKNRR